MKASTLIEIVLGIMLITLVFVIVPFYISNQAGDLYQVPNYNDTEAWKEICAIENPCDWYQIGCQRYCCVMDCSEINKNAGEIICVC